MPEEKDLLAKLLASSNNLINLAQELCKATHAIEAQDDEEFFYKGCIEFFFAKTFKTFSAVLLLIENKFIEDADTLLRGIFESLVNALYISQDPSKRARLFLEYDFVHRKKLLDIITERYKDEASLSKEIIEKRIEDRKDLLREYSRVEANYPDKGRWSGLSLEGMAQKVSLQEEYDFLYRYLSQRVHPSPSSIKFYIVYHPDGIEVFPHPTDQELTRIMVAAIVYFIDILRLKNQVFNLSFEDEINKLASQVQNLLSSGSEERT